jgi:hypothetical protein
MHLLEGPDLGHSTNLLWGEKGKKEKKKAQHPAGFEPTTSRVFAPEASALPLCYNRCPRQYLLVEHHSEALLLRVWRPWLGWSGLFIVRSSGKTSADVGRHVILFTPEEQLTDAKRSPTKRI